MIRTWLLIASMLAFVPSQLDAAEWWQDTFVSAETNAPCGDNDSIAAYGADEVKFWEHGCSIEKQTRLTGIEGIILNLSCQAEGEDLGKSRTVLMNVGDGRIASFPPLQLLKRCNATPTAPIQTSAGSAIDVAQCPSNSRLYRAPLFSDKRSNSYQELQFVSGDASGPIELREVRGGETTWTAQGEYGCSNGASICRLGFPLMSSEPVFQPYETVGSPSSDAPDLIVVPALKQQVLHAEGNSKSSGKAYGGLKANLLNGFFPKEGELILPENVFRFSACKGP